MNVSFWKSMEKEEEERKAQLELSNKINSTLTECLQLIEGVSEEGYHQSFDTKTFFLKCWGGNFCLNRNFITRCGG